MTAQIIYSKYNQRWTFPNFYYTVNYEFACDKTLSIIYLDTQMLCDQGQTEVNKQYPLPVTDEMKEAEMEWFRKELENVKNSDYILVQSCETACGGAAQRRRGGGVRFS